MYQFSAPHPLLRPHIENYWLLRLRTDETLPFAEAIWADGKPDILFNFGAPYERVNLRESGEITRASNLDAQRTYPVAIQQRGAIHLIGVRFRVGGLSPFLAVPMHELSGQVLDLNTLFGTAVRELEERLHDAQANAAQQFALLDHFFLRRLRIEPVHLLLRAVVQEIAEHGGSLAVPLISAKFGYSARSVDRFFQQYIGLPPKWLARVARFQRAARLMEHEKRLSLAALAALAGYYDHAHMTREFIAFTGQTPSRLRALRI